MRAAASAVWVPVLSSIDQSLDQLRAVDGLSDERWWKLARVLDFVPHPPSEFASTDEVWMVAESIEPHVFEALERFGASGSRADVDGSESIAGLDADLSWRLTYVEALARQLSSHHERSGPPLDARARRAGLQRLWLQRILDNVEVAPEVRLVLHQSRLLPVLAFLIVYTDRVTKGTGGRSQATIQEALRQGLDSLTGFLLALVPPSTAPAPTLIRDTLPEPMALTELTDRWRRVRETWTVEATNPGESSSASQPAKSPP